MLDTSRGALTKPTHSGCQMAKVFKPCSAPSCNGNSHWTSKGAHGLCRNHARRKKLYGSIDAGLRTPNGLPALFYQNSVLPCASDECLIWPYARTDGYAVMSTGGRPRTVHRMACIAVHGQPPSKEYEAAHTCGGGAMGCVNPRHLRWATPAANQADRAIHGTSNRGERCASSKLTEDEVNVIRSLKGTMTQQDIASIFGVNYITVGDIHNGRTWSWLPS